MIVGLTHEKDGSPRIHRTVTCKVAIGLPPDANSNYPKKLDHFVFLKQEMQGKELKWLVDQEKQEHFGASCKDFWIVLLSDDIDECFRTNVAAYVKTRCWCRGDGEKAERREKIGNDYKGDFKVWNGPCANHGCPDFESGACKPSGDLYFMLSDFPTLGTIARIHTSSYQSIRQIYSALQDLRAVTGGRLMGLRAKLFVRPARNVFEQNGQEKTGTKFVLGLELAAKDIPLLMESMAETAKMFMGLQKQLKGAVLEIEEDDEQRAPELSSEFYPQTIEGQAQVVEADPEKALREQADALMKDKWGLNQAQRMAKLGQYKGRMAELLERVKNSAPPANGNGHSSAPPSSAGAAAGSSPVAHTPPPPTSNIHGLNITDDDLPENLRPAVATTKPQTQGFDF